MGAPLCSTSGAISRARPKIDAWTQTGLHPGLWVGDWLARLLYSLTTRGARPEDHNAALVLIGVVTALVSITVLLSLGLV
jgi:hypothetical protein